MNRGISFSLMVFGLTLVPVGGWAVSGAAIGDEVLSARSMGQGQVGVAGQSEDPAVVYFNPAGMTLLPGTQVTVGLTGIDQNSTYRSDSGVESKMIDSAGIVPNFAMTHLFADQRLSIGFAAEAPYGFKSRWPDDGPLRTVATESKLYIIDLSPAIAYRLNDHISIGAAADYFNAFDAELKRQFPNAGAADGTSTFSGTGNGWSGHGGVMVMPNVHHTFAVAYHGKAKLTIHGTAEMDGLSSPLSLIMGGGHYETAAYADIFIPQNVQFGYAWRPDDRWMLEVDTAWFDWDSNHDLNLRFAESDPNKLAVLNAGNPMALERQSAWSVAAGVNYRAWERWEFRGGFGYVPNATPEWTFQPAVNDLSRYGICLGTGWHFAPLWTLDVAYSAVFTHSRQINDNPNPTINGHYSDMIHLLSANLTLRIPGKSQ